MAMFVFQLTATICRGLGMNVKVMMGGWRRRGRGRAVAPSRDEASALADSALARKAADSMIFGAVLVARDGRILGTRR
jgi:hypothetical protein